MRCIAQTIHHVAAHCIVKRTVARLRRCSWHRGDHGAMIAVDKYRPRCGLWRPSAWTQTSKVQEESAMANSHMLVGASTDPKNLVIRRITPSDLFDALARGIDDFVAMPSHAVFLCVIYPLLGIALIAMTLGNSTLPLAFPIAAGFALVGPLAAIGLYELSRRREAGLDSSTSHAFDVLHSPSLGAIVVLSLMLMAIFLVWLSVAQAIYVANFGYHAPESAPQFATEVLT